MTKSEEELLRLVLEAWYPSPLMKDLSLREMSPEDISRARRVVRAIQTHTATVAAEAARKARIDELTIFKTLGKGTFHPKGGFDYVWAYGVDQVTLDKRYTELQTPATLNNTPPTVAERKK